MLYPLYHYTQALPIGIIKRATPGVPTASLYSLIDGIPVVLQNTIDHKQQQRFIFLTPI